MALFPAELPRRPAHARPTSSQVVQETVSLRRVGSTLQGPLPVPQREDAVVPRQSRQGLLPLLRLRRRRQRLQVRRAARAPELPRGGARRGARSSASRCPRPATRATIRTPTAERESLIDAARGRGEVLSRRAGLARPAGAAASCWTSAAWTPEIVESLGYGFAPPGRDALLPHLRSKGLSPQLAVQGRPRRRSRRRRARRIGSGTA